MIKIIQAESIWDLEDAVNEWLENNNEEIININPFLRYDRNSSFFTQIEDYYVFQSIFLPILT